MDLMSTGHKNKLTSMSDSFPILNNVTSLLGLKFKVQLFPQCIVEMKCFSDLFFTTFSFLLLGTRIGTTLKMVPFYGHQNCISVMMYKLKTSYFSAKMLTQSPVFGIRILRMKYAIQQFSLPK